MFRVLIVTIDHSQSDLFPGWEVCFHWISRKTPCKAYFHNTNKFWTALSSNNNRFSEHLLRISDRNEFSAQINNYKSFLFSYLYGIHQKHRNRNWLGYFNCELIAYRFVLKSNLNSEIWRYSLPSLITTFGINFRAASTLAVE